MSKKVYRQKIDSWYLERILFLVAGIFVLISAVLGMIGFKGFILFTALVGLLLIVFAFTGYCPMAIILKKLGAEEK